MPYFEPSRPMPDSFMPPNGATSVEIMPVLMPTMPYSSASATRQMRLHVAAVEIGGEAEFGVVGDADRVVVAREAEQRRHRAEGFLARAFHLGRRAGEHGRLEERAAQLMALAAEHDARALGHGVGDMVLHFVERGLVDQRALRHAGGESVADLERADRLRQARGEFIVNRVLHEKAIGADAGLPGVAVFRGDGAIDRGVEIGVVEHDEGRVAAQFERDFFHRAGALPHQELADLGRAGEGQLAHDGIRGEFAADRGSSAGDDVEHAAGQARALGERGDGERRERRLLGRLDDDGAAGGQRRRDLARDHRDREIPRRDRGADANRLLQREQALVAPGARDRVAIDALGLLGEPFDERRAIGDLALGLGQRLALFAHHDRREIVGVGQDRVEPGAQDRAALLAGLGAPGGQGRARRRDGAPGLGRAEIGHGRDRVAIRRVVHGEALAAIGGDPGAGDEGLGS